ncbi:hypothetical protein LguiA_032937 [Lonicera macranthoides]
MDPTTNGNHSPPPPPLPLPRTQIWKYDVYLSFRGEDVRKTFVSHLHEALTVARIHAFNDDVDVQVGREISMDFMFKAIEESRISIVVFSENYATSRWCLDELVKILDCMKTRGQLVLPLFFNVHPSDVRKQEGIFRHAFERYNRCGEFEDHQKRWRRALKEAANLAGLDLHNNADGYEAKLIKKVVKEVQFFLARNNMMALEEEEAKLKEEEQTHQEKMEDLQKQMEAINLQAEALCLRRANLVARRSSLEEMKRQFGSDDMKIIQ